MERKLKPIPNKYSFVWKKSTDSYEEKIQHNIQHTFQQIKEAIELDQQLLADSEEKIKKVTSEQLA
ncbi:TPA: hypothetical protein SAX33_001872 [Bacillus cereus]|nr:hypothetical protein [Bacillus cereus]